MQLLQEAKKALAEVGKNNVIPSEEKTNDDETLVYANKLVRIHIIEILLLLIFKEILFFFSILVYNAT